MKTKIMFLYPNLRGMNMLPPAIGLLSAVLKRSGFEVKLFDTTYYEKLDGEHSEADSDKTKTDNLMARPFQMPNEISVKTSNVYRDFRQEVIDFKPNLIAVSATEDMFLLGIKLLNAIDDLDILTIMGGVFPTFAPQIALSYPEIDIICKGEGEDALNTLCERLEKNQNYDDIPNLWIKKKNGSFKVNQTKLVEMDKNPLIDMTIFEEARFYRPMAGKVWRMFPVETFRGCPYTCTYCNSPFQVQMYKDEGAGKYLRRKSFENMRSELLYYKNVMKAEYLYFWADTFFSWKPGDFDIFAEMYQEINLPFWCQTRAETVEYNKFKKLKDIGCSRISFGLEHGNEEFRQRVLKRRVKNKTMIDNFKILNDLDIPFSVNNIIGFPEETYNLAFDTIELNRQIDATDRNAYAFTPFHGTSLRTHSENLGLVKEGEIANSILVKGSILNMPYFPNEEVRGLLRTFNMYVKFPKSRWDEIKIAEKETPEGDKVYNNLKQEFIDKFWNSKSENFEEASMEI